MPGTEHKPQQDNLLAAIYGRPLPNDKYRRYLGGTAKNALLRGGSVNIPMMAVAAAVIGGSRLDRQMAEEWWDEFFMESKFAFMGRELMSRTYGLWHLIAVLAVFAKGPLNLRARAREWILCFITLLWATSDADGRTCFGGMRSAGHDLSHDAYEWVLAVAMSKPTSRWAKGWVREWTYAALTMLQGDLAEATAGWRNERNKRVYMENHRPLAEVSIKKGLRCAVWWIQKNLHSSTPPWLCGSIRTGEPAMIFPRHGGTRIRGRFDKATTAQIGPLSARKIAYYGDLYEGGTLAIPHDDWIFSLRWSPSVTHGDLPPEVDPPIGDPDDEPPAKPEKLSAIERLQNWWARIMAVFT